MSPTEAVERLQPVLAHLWMIRTFLKHADEVTDDEQLIEIPRLLYDSIRAVEPAFLRQDYVTYIRRLKGKLGKLKKGADLFAQEYSRVSAHTNFEMASLSLSGAVRQMGEILAQVSLNTPAETTDSGESDASDNDSGDGDSGD